MLQNHPPHHHQSPSTTTRLPLLPPTSPSLSNPATPKLPSYHPPPPTSSTLLSLQPPLSRAQSLLLQMASLSTKLFELSPNRSLWLSSFRGTLPSFLPSQSQTPAPPLESSPSTTKELLSLFTSLQTQLFESVTQLQEILDLQDTSRRLNSETKSKDSSLLAFANKLKEAKHILDSLVDDYSDYRLPKRAKSSNIEATNEATPIGASVKLSEILSCAHRISYTTFAPPEFGAGQALLRGALPPAPQDEQMRASQLYAFADLDIGLPKEDLKEKIVETLIESPPSVENSPLGVAGLGLLPPDITVPSGWKPGMPVELPNDLPLPPPPPGWKPGDPIPLPPLDALVSNKAPWVVPPHMQPSLPPMASKVQPQTVDFVQLDINPEEGDYSSDYSSEGSSEEDDED